MLIPDVAAATDRLVELVEDEQRRIDESWQALASLDDDAVEPVEIDVGEPVVIEDDDTDPNSLLVWDRIIRANAQR